MISTLPGLRIAAERPVYSRSCVLYAFDPQISFHVGELSSKTLEQSATVEPFLTLSIDEGQKFFDALYGAGYRRQGDTDDTREVAAINAHVRSLQTNSEFFADIISRMLPDDGQSQLSRFDWRREGDDGHGGPT